jgi:hypothetical protein
MEQLASIPIDVLVDPAVLLPSLAVCAALVSGVAARVVEFVEDLIQRRKSNAEVGRS